ncbi:hypothetical protein [Cellulomonas hominis]|uniref:hypothetical protein n=1 Tax=Cellulomonas hominis TaxID=156981 RepID=UPI001B965994|nr:hypothetical protein [Cellulomonas hominis]VTR75925.1 hypothetical protein CHMI_00679 [Cellulomonas hominis]
MAGRARVVRAVGAAALVGGLVGALAACGSDEPGTSGTEATEGTTPTATAGGELELTAGSSAPGLPPGAGEQPADAVAGAARTADDTLLYVVTFGSSTCPDVADATAGAAGTDAVEVTFPEQGDDPCTADYVPTTTVVALPESVDAASDLAVTIGTWGEVTLPPGSQDVVWAVAEG